MPPVVELFSFVASEAYRNDPVGSLQGFLPLLNKAPGEVKAYHGLQVEDPMRGYVIVVWETYEDHKALMESGESFEEIKRASGAAVSEGIFMYHVLVRGDPIVALDAPVVEIAVITRKEGGSQDELGTHLDALSSLSTEGVVGGATWGLTREKDDVSVMFVGWQSVEAHQAIASNRASEEGKLVQNIFGLSSVTINHTKLIQD